MDRLRAANLARNALWLGLVLLLAALVVAVWLYADRGAAVSAGWALILAAAGLALVVPAGYALAMLK